MSNVSIVKDKIKGMLYGVAIGDTLGVPHEFSRSKPKIDYTGIMSDTDISIPFRFVTKVMKAHSISDDTEMTLTLLSSILYSSEEDDVANNEEPDITMGSGIYKYNLNNTILSYLEWANSGNTTGSCGMMGKNTRELLKGVKTLKGYNSRKSKIAVQSQSNGSLMRCSPLVLLFNYEEMMLSSDLDVAITNDNDVNKECSRIYLGILHFLVYGGECILPLQSDIRCDSVRVMLEKVSSREIINISGEKKGWVVHTLYAALLALLESTNFESGLDYIANTFMNKGSTIDSDTVMAVAGGLLGAAYGYVDMSNDVKTSQNISKLKEYFSRSDTQYRIDDDIIEKLKISSS